MPEFYQLFDKGCDTNHNWTKRWLVRLLTKNLLKSNKLFTIYYVSLKIKEFKWQIFVYFKIPIKYIIKPPVPVLCRSVPVLCRSVPVLCRSVPVLCRSCAGAAERPQETLYVPVLIVLKWTRNSWGKKNTVAHSIPNIRKKK